MSSADEFITDSFLEHDPAEEIVAASHSNLSDEDDDDDEEDEDVEIEAMDDDSQDGTDNSPDGVIAQLIDIREPLTNLRRALERRLDADLSAYDFWLQDSQLLPEDTTLVEQCVQGEGLVQINVEIKTDPDGVHKINIIDVLKPAEDALNDDQTDFRHPQEISMRSPPPPSKKAKKDSVGSSNSNNTESQTTRWVVCANFRKEQERLSIPTDPVQWNSRHVAHWIKWTIKEFPKAAISESDWNMDGKELCSMSHEDFKRKVPIDSNDLMWTHLELLRKCKFVAVVQKGPVNGSSSAAATVKNGGLALASSAGAAAAANQIPRKTNKKPPVRLGAAKFTVMSESALGNRTGNNGQVQLWQFLLELLTGKEHREVIHWIGNDGEFKLENPERVAQLWGTRKNKPNMNYEKLSRALRYYYDGDMISKVHGKRFVYKYVCDLRQLIGYSAEELNRLVMEAEQKSKSNRYH